MSLTLFASIACSDDGGSEEQGATETGDGDGDPATGDGDGDPATGDGDGDGTGDGDGDTPTGDGDGDATGDGDGDGDTTTGDGDGDPTGDGDGDPTGDGDGDTGDGDGDPGPGFDCDPELDPVILTLDGGEGDSARYPTIADAVFAAPDAALVQICPGMYDESVLVDDGIEIQGAGPGQTILVPSEEGAFFIDADGVTIRDLSVTGATGFEIQNFGGTCGGAIFIERDFNMATTTLLSNLELTDNSARYGGAICVNGGVFGTLPTVTVEDSVIENNIAELEGGGLFVRGRIHMVNTAVVGNMTEEFGGGGLNIAQGCRALEQCSITDSVIQSNTAPEGLYNRGGGMWLGDFLDNQGDQGTAITVTNSDFGFGFDEENQPDDVLAMFDNVPTSYGFYANGVSFTCEDGVCTDP